MSLLLLFSQPPYHKTLLDAADRLLADHPAIALVTAHMACEICVEQIIAAGFRRRGIADLEDPVTEFFPSNNLANDRIRNVYSALTGDRIHETPFWARFKDSAGLRNRAVHRGAHVSREEGQAGCAAVRELVAHLQGVAETLR